MKLKFLPEAEMEFREAARFYEDRAPGLGFAFVTEVHRATNMLLTQPLIGAPLVDDLRKYVLRRFPYNLIYADAADTLIIVALAHHKRRPFYWSRILQNRT